MKTMESLVRFIAGQDSSVVHLQPETLLEKFYKQLAAGNIENDAEAASLLYDAEASDPRYQRLKSDLKKRLYEAPLLLDPRKLGRTDRQQAYFQCAKDGAVAKILFGKHKREAAIQLSKKLLQLAEKYEFTEVVLNIHKLLRIHYGTWTGEPKQYKHHNHYYKHYQQLWQWEAKAEEYFTELTLQYVQDKSLKTETRQQAQAYYDELAAPLQEYDAYQLHLCGRLIQLAISSSIDDHEATVRTCEDAMTFFRNKPYQAHAPLQIFSYQQLLSYIQLRRYEAGRKLVQASEEWLQEGDFNWFKFQESYLKLAFHTQQYTDAYDTFMRVIEHSRFRYLPSELKEVWRIYEAYLHYVLWMGAVDVKQPAKRFNKFRLGKFLNETPIFSKDKRGMNVTILIIQILFLIAREKYDAVIDKAEAVEKYCSRYLKKDETYRSNCFIKMLLQMPKSAFHPAAVRRHTGKLLKKLKQYPSQAVTNAHDIEILPYETLWAFALDSLDQQQQADMR